MAKAKKIETTKTRRTPKRLSHTLYAYTSPTNGKWARTFGKEHFGSFSNYIDILISADREQNFSAKWLTTQNTKKTKKVTGARTKKTATAVNENQAA